MGLSCSFKHLEEAHRSTNVLMRISKGGLSLLAYLEPLMGQNSEYLYVPVLLWSKIGYTILYVSLPYF